MFRIELSVRVFVYKKLKIKGGYKDLRRNFYLGFSGYMEKIGCNEV